MEEKLLAKYINVVPVASFYGYLLPPKAIYRAETSVQEIRQRFGHTSARSPCILPSEGAEISSFFD